MNKRNYILMTLLAGYSLSASSQQTDALSGKSMADTLSVGYQLSVPSNLNSYSVSRVKAEAFENSSAIDVSKSLYGKIAGLTVRQGVGSSADNVSSLSIHGNAPLILVDGFPRDLADVTALEIESCQILKDAAATALYGMKGANGVLLITTKRGKNAKLNVKAEYHFGLHSQFRTPTFADAFTYANAINTALVGDGLPQRYNDYELEAFRTGSLPYEYPNVNWWDHTMNDHGFTHNLKLSFNGGNDKFRYFTVVDYYRDGSMLKENSEDKRYSTKPTDTRLNIRTNLDINITETTYMKAGLVGKLQELNGPVYGRNEIFKAIYNTPSAAFPIRYDNGIFGGSSTYGDKNPVALLKNKGHVRNMYGTLLADMSLRQDLSSLTDGLQAEASISFDNIGGMQESSHKEYSYMHAYPHIESDGTLVTTPIVYGKDSKELGHKQPFERLMMRSDFQAKVAYDRLFGKHQVSGALIYDMQSVTYDGRNHTTKNQSAIFNATYVYDNRYVLNGVVNYTGSAYLPDGDKYRTYPAVSAAWIASNEAFMKKFTFINLVKLRASYGFSGWDGSLTHELWRQAYGAGNDYYFGSNANNAFGSAEGNLPVVGLTSEKSEKATLGLDVVALKNRLSVSVDGFYEKRSDVLVSGSSSTSGIIGIGVGKVCEGVYKYKGLDAVFQWKDQVGKFSYGIGATMSYLDTEIVNENQAYQEYDYLYHTGNRIGQCYGLEAIGFFNSQQEINNSPLHTFSQVAPGDVKYKDQNGDNRIDSKDIVKMFGSTLPRFSFGFQLQAAYKGLEVSADFQGLTGITTSLLDSPLYKPLVDNGNISQTILDREVFWTPENKTQATMPRLTTLANPNNYQASSLWYRDGSFLKLRNLTVAYTLPRIWTRIADVKVFVQGNNLFSLDNLDFADPEQLAIAYPSVRSYWAGVKLNF